MAGTTVKPALERPPPPLGPVPKVAMLYITTSIKRPLFMRSHKTGFIVVKTRNGFRMTFSLFSFLSAF
jgi:hypothetical protein